MRHPAKRSVKKGLSGLGILVMLVLKQPPLPEFVFFRRMVIESARGFPRQKVALDFHIN